MGSLISSTRRALRDGNRNAVVVCVQMNHRLNNCQNDMVTVNVKGPLVQTRAFIGSVDIFILDRVHGSQQIYTYLPSFTHSNSAVRGRDHL